MIADSAAKSQDIKRRLDKIGGAVSVRCNVLKTFDENQ